MTQRSILLGIGGGVAAYKSAALASSLRKAGWQVTVAMTPAAVKFVTPLTFAAVTGQPVLHEAFPEATGPNPETAYPHLYPATRVDACVLAPATADLIAKAAHGQGTDVLTSSLLSLPHTCLRLFCPAMNVEMWQQPVVQENVAKLERLGWLRIGPDSGHLACGAVGPGRMAEPEYIAAALQTAMASRGRLAGRRLMITSGPTVEHIDPVRFISNHSSGRMGRAIAEAAALAGATVDFITGPVGTAGLPVHPGVRIHQVVSARDMLAAAATLFPAADAAIFVAAVADYSPGMPMPHKEPKKLDGLTIPLAPNPDIAASLCPGKSSRQRCIGFALETDDGISRAQSKLARKGFDAIVLNGVSSFGGEEGHFTWISTDKPDDWGSLSKTACADRIIDRLVAMLPPA